MSGTKSCAHANCHCPRSSDDTPYCGPYCANDAENESLPGDADPEGTCACGHAACKQASPDPVGPETVTSTGRT